MASARNRWAFPAKTVSDGLRLQPGGFPRGARFRYRQKAACNVPCRCTRFIDQVLAIREVMQHAPATWVFMGMGEAPSQHEAVLEAINCLCSDLGMVPAPDHVSTVGRGRPDFETWAGLATEPWVRNQFNPGGCSLHCPRPSPLRES